MYLSLRVRRLFPLIACLALFGLVVGPKMSLPIARASGAIAGSIFQDYNANGLRDVGTPSSAVDDGVRGVTVSAIDASGAVVATTVSAANGLYTLSSPALTALASGTALRIEFTALPKRFEPAPFGPQSDTTVQFVTTTAQGLSNVNVGLLIPANFCQNNPGVVTNCYIKGDQVTAPDDVEPVLVSVNYDATGNFRAKPALAAQIKTTAIARQVGTTYGLGYQRSSRSLFASAYLKRRAGFGPGGAGMIYRIAADGTVTQWLDVAQLLSPADPALITGPIPARTYAGPQAKVDIGIRSIISKRSFGDMDISEDDTKLYIVNLFTRELFEIPVGPDGSAPTAAGQIKRYAIPAPNPDPVNCAADDVRPFGLGELNGAVYIGTVCSAESTPSEPWNDTFFGAAGAGRYNTPEAWRAATGVGTVQFGGAGPPVPRGIYRDLDYSNTWTSGETFTDTNGNKFWDSGDPSKLHAYVQMLPAGGGAIGTESVHDYGLQYPRDCLVASNPQRIDDSGTLNGRTVRCRGGNYAEWRAWADEASSANPEPLLSDIAFDHGDMIIGMRDRWTDRNPGFSGGDILRSAGNDPLEPTSWTQESNGTVGTRTSGGVNNGEGPNNGEFYFRDNFLGKASGTYIPAGIHSEISGGGLAQVAGFNDVMVSSYDSLDEQTDPIITPPPAESGLVNSGGLIRLSNLDGTKVAAVNIYDDRDPFDASLVGSNFGKANGIGSVESMCDAAPIEVGNRVWLDTNKNGVQDAGEAALGGVTVRLYDENNQLIATVITDANGNYIFSSYIGTNTTSLKYNLGGFGTDGIPNTADDVPGLKPSDSRVSHSYTIRLDNSADYATGGALATLGVTVPSATQASRINDSNGVATLNPVGSPAGSFPVATFSTAGAERNNHTYDFGFTPAPTAIALSGLTAGREGTAMVVRWTTSAEIDTWGFDVYRSATDRREDAVKLTAQRILAHGAGDYSYVDISAPADGVSRYWLVETELSGRTNEYGPAALAAPKASYTMFIPFVARQ